MILVREINLVKLYKKPWIYRRLKKDANAMIQMHEVRVKSRLMSKILIVQYMDRSIWNRLSSSVQMHSNLFLLHASWFSLNSNYWISRISLNRRRIDSARKCVILSNVFFRNVIHHFTITQCVLFKNSISKRFQKNLWAKGFLARVFFNTNLKKKD